MDTGRLQLRDNIAVLLQGHDRSNSACSAGILRKWRKKFAANWREPRLFIIYAVDEHGRMTKTEQESARIKLVAIEPAKTCPLARTHEHKSNNVQTGTLDPNIDRQKD